MKVKRKKMANRVDVATTRVSMPIRNMRHNRAKQSECGVILGVERLNISETKITLLEKDLQQPVEMLETDLEKNTEFRIKFVKWVVYLPIHNLC